MEDSFAISLTHFSNQVLLMNTHLISTFALTCLFVLPATADPHRDGPTIAAALHAAQHPLDACGGENLLDIAVPDGPFLSACRMHDACYRSGAKNQYDCDTDFLLDMRDACEISYPKHNKPVRHLSCMGVAQTYFMAVNSSLGSRHFNTGGTHGALVAYTQQRLLEDDRSDELRTCVTVKNTSGRKIAYQVRLHNQSGDWVDTEPDIGKAHLQPTASKRICVDTDRQPLEDWDTMGETYTITLKADDPDRFSPFGDFIDVDRLECDRATGHCSR